MAKAKRPQKKNLKSLGFIALGVVGMVVGFVTVFLSTNNISISLNDLMSSSDSTVEMGLVRQVKAKKKKKKKKKKPGHTMVELTTNEGVSANLDFDRRRQRLNLVILDRHARPIPQLKVIARISKVGTRHQYRSIRLRENSTGNFNSVALNLPEGGWVLSISAYNLFNENFNRLIFHSEQSIYLGEKS